MGVTELKGGWIADMAKVADADERIFPTQVKIYNPETGELEDRPLNLITDPDLAAPMRAEQPTQEPVLDKVG